MTTILKFSVRATAAAAALMLSGAVLAAPAIDANIELDNTYRNGSNVENTDNEGLFQSGRVEANLTSKAGENMFVAAKAALIAGKDGTVKTDDMWIQLGSKAGDLKLGRFEATELFGLMGDTLVNHAGNGTYGAGDLRGRKGDNQFHAAGTINLAAGVSFELGLIDTKVAGAAKGVRPVLNYASGPLSVSIGVESGTFVTSGNKVRGFGAKVGYDFGPAKLQLAYANGRQDAVADLKRNAIGLSASMGGLAGGVALGKNEVSAGVDEKITTVYVSYKMSLFDIKGASITPALSSSTSKTDGAADKQETAFRVRLNYAF
jgi:hypothetical protein